MIFWWGMMFAENLSHHRIKSGDGPFPDHALESRCRGEGDHLTSRPDAKRWKTRSGGSGAAVRHKEKNPPSAQYRSIRAVFGEAPDGIAIGLFKPMPGQRE